jgi:hypothetical protein
MSPAGCLIVREGMLESSRRGDMLERGLSGIIMNDIKLICRGLLSGLVARRPSARGCA